MRLTSAAVTMWLQHWLFLILTMSIATTLASGSRKKDPGKRTMGVEEDPGDDYVVGGVPLVEPHQSRPGAAAPTPGGLDWDGFEWVATVKVYTEVKYYFARKVGMTRQGCEKYCPNPS